jgi:threonine dehydratase
MKLQDIVLAKKRIASLIKQTELRESSYFSNLIQGNIFLKLENLQITNSFKIRGAINKLYQMGKEDKEIITASSGNHGQAVARASKKLGLSAKIIVPEGTPKKKKELIQKYGVELIIYGKTVDEAESYGREIAQRDNKVYVSPYNDPDIIAGQGTIGLELIEQLPSLQSMLVPIGGGGLISGVAIAIKQSNPNIEVIGIQAQNDAAMYHSQKTGKILSPDQYPHSPTLADGLAGGIEQASLTFSFVQKYVDQILLVKEESIEKAINLLWEKEKLIVEGAGAVGIAALLENPNQFSGQIIAVVLSGGNIDKSFFSHLNRKI